MMNARKNSDSYDPNSKLLAQASNAKKKAYLVGFLCQLSTLSHSAPSHLSVDPLVLGSAGVAGAESRAIGISLCPTAIISFALTTHLLFTFTPEMEEGEGEGAFTEAVARAGDDGHENELLFSPFTEWMEENVVSYLVRAWLLAKTDIHAKVGPVTFLFLISLLGKCCLLHRTP